ncbi:uncharacterized protein LOC116707443 [Etheostoma spectabile]|uniref:uncharacterized protein LOC116707065 n=1 Tax=Etheostoma spectabile TaxID=54343 RepID=UPI0013AF297D|nr:uncharacterized protein LOC116707065 [Etheostoma spectabile]XP_032400672.1 uncharacterized protein LOC116707443 [Etheostoma spectabile]
MSRTFQSVDLLALSFLLLMVKSQQDPILPPQNVSLRWINDFLPEWSWAPPQHSKGNCKYEVQSNTKDKNRWRGADTVKTTWRHHAVMQGGYLQFTVKTVCGDKHSTEVGMEIDYTELVKNLECYIHSAKQTHCSWLPGSHAPDLKFYYRFWKDDFTVSPNDKTTVDLRECSLYAEGVRTACDLEASISQTIEILINGTHNNSFARNTFQKKLRNHVRPPALKWTVNKSKNKFLINWTPPDIQVEWTYIVNYTECVQTKNESFGHRETSTVLNLVPHCQYSFAIKATSTGGGTPWSDVKNFAAETDPNAWLYAAAIVPLMFAGLAVLGFVCFRKHKEHIFPKVPEPRDLVSDIFDNNNKSTVCNLYIPAEEEDNCKITLVEEP